MKIIDRYWIHESFKLKHHSSESVIDREELFSMIDFWKVVLHEKYNIAPGHLVGLQFVHTDAYYFALAFAVIELGASLLVMDKPSTPAGIHNIKTKIFAPIDLIVVDDSYNNDPIIKVVVDSVARQIGYREDYNSYTIQNPEQFDHVSKTVLATESTVLLTTTTSGTTGTPKVVKHTHSFYFDLCKRNVSVLEFTPSSVALHTRNLHHGSSLDLFFLPSLHAVPDHYYDNSLDTKSITNVINDKKVTHVYSVFTVMTDKIIQNLGKLDHSLTIIALSFILPHWEDMVKNKNIHRIVSSFGSSETGGPIFAPELNKHTNGFDAMNYGKLVDDFFTVRIVNDTLHVTNKSNHNTIVMQDKFTFENGAYRYHGRSSLLRVNDVEVIFNELDKYAERFFNKDAIVIVDVPRQQFYLALFKNIDQSLIDDFYQEFETKYNPNTIKVNAIVDLNEFVVGVKIDRELLRDYFRTLIN
jgi:acyl-coenzyme A synthetase/AMP-(fatty) acid ligase